MAGKKLSKNNPDNKGKNDKLKIVLESECRACETQCAKGLHYIETYAKRLWGKGVACKKG